MSFITDEMPQPATRDLGDQSQEDIGMLLSRLIKEGEPVCFLFNGNTWIVTRNSTIKNMLFWIHKVEDLGVIDEVLGPDGIFWQYLTIRGRLADDDDYD